MAYGFLLHFVPQTRLIISVVNDFLCVCVSCVCDSMYFKMYSFICFSLKCFSGSDVGTDIL